jgi:hypothetical protein
MAQIVGPTTLAAAGSTGNNSHAAVPVGDATDKLTFRFVVEAVGATPTVTYKVQSAVVRDEAAPATTDWEDLAVVTPTADALITTKVVTAVGSYVTFPLPHRVNVTHVRLVTSANTNVTYRAELFEGTIAS